MLGQPEGFEYIEKFLPFPQQIQVLKELRGLQYEHEMFRGRLMKREWAQFGYSYKAAARKVDTCAGDACVSPGAPAKRERLLPRRSHVHPVYCDEIPSWRRYRMALGRCGFWRIPTRDQPRLRSTASVPAEENPKSNL